MAIPGGYRFKIPFDDVFPQGCYVMSVERAKGKNVEQVVKIVASYQPEPLAAIPGTPFRPATFDEMTAVPDTLWAKGVRSALSADQGSKPAAKLAAA